MERTEALGRKKKRASKIYDSKKDKWIENYDTKPKNKFLKKSFIVRAKCIWWG